MACQNTCKLCENLVISTSVTFAGGNLTIDIPAGAYQNCHKYCLVIAQAIPDTTTITAPVLITIGGAATTYPVVDRCGAPVTASQVRTRTRYSTRVVTGATGGSFKLLSCLKSNQNVLNSLPAPAAAETV